MREGGLEPPHPCEYWHLKPARLPIPPPAQRSEIITARCCRALPYLADSHWFQLDDAVRPTAAANIYTVRREIRGPLRQF